MESNRITLEELSRNLNQGFDDMSNALRKEIELNNDRFISMAQAQQILGIRSRATLLEWIKAGIVPRPTLFGSSKRFKYSEIMNAGTKSQKYGHHDR